MTVTMTPPKLSPADALAVRNNKPVDPETAKQQELRDKAGQWAAQTFFGTMLKQMHDSPFKDEKFSGGRGGEAFGGMMDQQMIEHLAKGVGSKLVNSIAKSLDTSKRDQAPVPIKPLNQPQKFYPIKP